GRRGVPVHVVSLRSSPQIASASRYCRGFTPVADLSVLHEALLQLDAGAIVYVDNDPMLKALAPHAAALAARFALVDEIGDAARLTDKDFQMRLARQVGIAVPRSWPGGDLPAIKTQKRLIAKPAARRLGFKALIAANPAELASMLRARGAAPADVLVQEYVEGDDSQIYAGLCYRARSGGQCFVLSARKLRQTQPGAGVMAVGQVVDAPHVREMTRRLAKAAGARGVLSTEFKLDARDGRWYFIEWNPRPAYFQSIGWKAGFDLAWLAYCDRADPAALAGMETTFSGSHYWVNLRGDLMHLSKAPRLALDLKTWRPYLGRREWAVFAPDDPAPWRKALRQLGGWLSTRKFFGRASGRLAAPGA